MALVVVTDTDPIAALRALFFRVGSLLLPASIYMIRYSGVGLVYNIQGWEATGVTTNKNILGAVVFTVGLGALWSLHLLLRARGEPGRGRRLLAQFALVGCTVLLLRTAHSATSVACFTLGSALVFVIGLRGVKHNPAAIHAIVFGGLAMLYAGQSVVVAALGRNSDLTGRTQIWDVVIPMAKDPMVGAGFESFWNSSSGTLRSLIARDNRRVYMFGNLNSAHNGYIDMYLNLGWVGVGLLALLLISGYRNACTAFRHYPDAGGVLLAYVVAGSLYSVTEAGFRLMSPTWFSLLLALVAAGRLSVGPRGNPQPVAAPAEPAPELAAGDSVDVWPGRIATL
jgi:O-antigen ligase